VSAGAALGSGIGLVAGSPAGHMVEALIAAGYIVGSIFWRV
jgi:hypothetical protein